MSKLITTPNLKDADGFYEKLIDIHEGLSKEESDALNARLILVLANHVGECEVLDEAFDIAVNSAEGKGE